MSEAPEGHIKLARKAFDKEHGDVFWMEPRTFSKWEAWVDLIQQAAWKASRWITKKYGTIDLARGEFVAAIRRLAERWGWHRNAVHHFLSTLKKTGRLTGQRTGRYGTVYLIVNYEHYQNPVRRIGTQDGTEVATEAGRSRDKKETVSNRESSSHTGSNSALAPKRGASWVGAVVDIWTREVGTVAPGRVGKELKAHLERVGIERLLSGIRYYIRLCKAQNKPPVWAFFVGSVSVWVEKSDDSLSPVNGELHGELDTLTAPIKLVRPVA